MLYLTLLTPTPTFESWSLTDGKPPSLCSRWQDEGADLLGDDRRHNYHYLPINRRRPTGEPRPRAQEESAAEEGTSIDIGGGAIVAVRNGVLIQVNFCEDGGWVCTDFVLMGLICGMDGPTSIR